MIIPYYELKIIESDSINTKFVIYDHYYEEKLFTGIAFRGKEIFHIFNGRYHKDDGPAIIYEDGTSIYFKNGMYHREDGPAKNNDYYLNDIKIEASSDEEFKKIVKLFNI